MANLSSWIWLVQNSYLKNIKSQYNISQRDVTNKVTSLLKSFDIILVIRNKYLHI